jgi:hypothetical protein
VKCEFEVCSNNLLHASNNYLDKKIKEWCHEVEVSMLGSSIPNKEIECPHEN